MSGYTMPVLTASLSKLKMIMRVHVVVDSSNTELGHVDAATNYWFCDHA